MTTTNTQPRIYLFPGAPIETRAGRDYPCYALAEDGTVLGSHICSSPRYLRHDLHDYPARRRACQRHYPEGYELVVLGSREEVPGEVWERYRDKYWEEVQA